MALNKKKHKFFLSFLTLILIGSSLTSGYLIYNNIKIKSVIKPIDENPLLENKNLADLQKENLANAIRTDLTSEIIDLKPFMKAINYTEKSGFITYKIDDNLLEPILKETIQKAIVKKQKNLIPLEQFSGKIYYDTNNLNMNVNVIITWKDNQNIKRKYYDHFQINFVV